MKASESLKQKVRAYQLRAVNGVVRDLAQDLRHGFRHPITIYEYLGRGKYAPQRKVAHSISAAGYDLSWRMGLVETISDGPDNEDLEAIFTQKARELYKALEKEGFYRRKR